VRELRLLEYLAAHRGRVFTRDQLLDAVWKETAFVTPRPVDVYVRRLWEKIESDANHSFGVRHAS
jgi:DNA-binding response OmpR family regulator